MSDMQLAFDHVKGMTTTHHVNYFQRMVVLKPYNFVRGDLRPPMEYRRINIDWSPGSGELHGLLPHLKEYEDKLAREMLGYRGVIHESAVSELKHDKVMVLKAMVADLKEEIAKLEK